MRLGCDFISFMGGNYRTRTSRFHNFLAISKKKIFISVAIIGNELNRDPLKRDVKVALHT